MLESSVGLDERPDDTWGLSRAILGVIESYQLPLPTNPNMYARFFSLFLYPPGAQPEDDVLQEACERHVHRVDPRKSSQGKRRQTGADRPSTSTHTRFVCVSDACVGFCRGLEAFELQDPGRTEIKGFRRAREGNQLSVLQY